MAPVIAALQAARANGQAVDFRLIHTGQHYHPNLSNTFFQELNIPPPDVNLGVGSGTQSAQTAAIMMRYEALLIEKSADICVVAGDVNSTVACALAAKKQGLRLAHIEAGLRSRDRSMPEEINRIVTDSISDYFFTTSDTAGQNLQQEGIPADQIFFVGNTMIDTLLRYRPQFRPPALWQACHLQEKAYLLLTLHRPENVNQPGRIQQILAQIGSLSRGIPIVFPVHPRTEALFDFSKVKAPNVHLTGPLPYLEFNYLTERAQAVITDSGGITEETTVMGVPCITLRNHTERPETVTIGTNELIGNDSAALDAALQKVFSGQWKKGRVPALWDGRAGERIVEILLKYA